MAFYVDIVASQRNGTIYIGSTDNLLRRIWEHKTGAREGFTTTYGLVNRHRVPAIWSARRLRMNLAIQYQ